ncbi:penicillin-binding protein 1B [Pseudomaricurvus alkylphenolicus]|uniref:penicillin-binding protein 1B n=1 Tax=Pseudomaricurvus alkylphenolicus TaxID=1306991 RepID=UPI00142135AB|nr:penicillin-binding protein 1B [Pseudomaricurvus alkylphenolicus]NIB39035.1 penicillin-binding protein 1B [Pseudomaricurvus alkylphenolicus]
MSRSKSRRKNSPPVPRRRFFWRLLGALILFIVVLAVAWTGWLDVRVRDKFEGRKWALPARVYAQPLELYQGRQVRWSDLEAELQALEYRNAGSVKQPGQFHRSGNTLEIYTRGFEIGPDREASRRVHITWKQGFIQSLKVAQGNAGAAADIVRLEPPLIGGIYPRRQEDRELLRLEEIPPLLGEALIAVEDRNFVDHFGVSPKGILRAAWANLSEGRVVQGGSTLTQQLVKNFYLDNERRWSRKLTEAAMSVLLEFHYSKAEILETYMNEVYLGQSGPRQIHGFGLAAKHYFGVPLQKLNTEQLALLVGLVKGASYYNPWRHPQRARERRNLVLTLLHQQGLIDAKTLQRSQQAPLGLVAKSRSKLQQFPAFIDLVKRQLRRDYSDEALSSEGLKIYTTLSLSSQRSAEKALYRRLSHLEKRYGLKDEPLQGAVIVTAVGSAEVEAVVGDRNVKFSGFNRALDARRPIGSLVKPAIVLTALESGQFHLASKVSDGPVAVKGPDGEIWRPRNFDRQSHGDVLLIDALAHSYNQASARLGMQLGLRQVADTLRQLGVQQPIPELPSMLLGAVELSPLDVSGMYHTLANDGVAAPLRSIRTVVDSEGQILNRYPLQLHASVGAEANALLQFGLQAVMREGSGKSAYARLPQQLGLAGKTGTTNAQRDSWFAGFDARQLAVVWVGRDDNRETPLTGSSGALRVWTDVFEALPKQGLGIYQTERMRLRWIDGPTGLLSGENCEESRLLPFIDGFEPRSRAKCQWRENPVYHWLKKWL